MDKTINLQEKFTQKFVSQNEFEALRPFVAVADKLINEKSGLGNDFLGWVKLPECYNKEEFTRIKNAAKKIRNDCDVFIVIGIGGSYLGARAAIEFLKSPLYNDLPKDTPNIYFVGNSINPAYLNDVIKI